MRFDLVDRVLDSSDTHIVTLKQISGAEEYLQDHFPGYPVLPGVMMLEAMVQAGRRLCEPKAAPGQRLVLGKVRALKYGRFVRPGFSLRVEVTLAGGADGEFDLKGEGRLLDPAAGPGELPVAVSGRFVLRPARVLMPG